MDAIYIVAGLFLLFAGGEGLVKGSVALAERMGLSTLLVSIVVVGFGTSAPELLVCLKAALSGTGDMAVGNTIGSNIANVLLIIGVGAVIKPIICDNKDVRRDSLSVIAASLLVTAIALTGAIMWYTGAVLVVALVTYLVWSYWREKHETEQQHEDHQKLYDHTLEVIDPVLPSLRNSVLFSIAGIVGVVLGAEFLVEGASSVARQFGVSDLVIGLTLVALGTSLPELATAVMASLKGHTDVIIGNVLGSNMFNILGILGLTAIITPLALEPRVMQIDIWLMLGSAVILYPVVVSGHRVSRLEGAGFLALYSGYIASMMF